LEIDMAVLNASPAVVLGGVRGIPVRLPRIPGSQQTALLVALIVAFTLTLLGSMTIGAPVTSQPATAASGPVVVESAAYPAWTVQSGDTLWSIAQRTRPNADPRAVILQIRVLNGLSAGRTLQAGDVLQLPSS